MVLSTGGVDVNSILSAQWFIPFLLGFIAGLWAAGKFFRGGRS